MANLMCTPYAFLGVESSQPYEPITEDDERYFSNVVSRMKSWLPSRWTYEKIVPEDESVPEIIPTPRSEEKPEPEDYQMVSVSRSGLSRALTTYFLDRSDQTQVAAFMRSEFRSFRLIREGLPKDHPHPLAASSRASATTTIDAYCNYVRRRPYYVQMSRTDGSRGRAGYIEYRWTKDLYAPAKYDEPLPGDIRVIIDTDWYLHMPSILLTPKPTMLYTFMPEAVAGNIENGKFTFTKDNELQMIVSGCGAPYRHHLWNYDYETITVTHFSVCTGWTAVTYLVEKKRISYCRYIVFLIPMHHVSGLTGFLVGNLDSHPLERLTVNVGEFSRLGVMTPEGELMVSTGRAGAYTSTTIPVAIDESLGVAARTSKNQLSLSTVQSYLPSEEYKTQASNLLEFFRTLQPLKYTIVYPVADAVRTYNFDLSLVDEPKPTLVAFMSPLVHGALCPAKNLASDIKFIEDRIEKPKAEAKTLVKRNNKGLTISRFQTQCMEEFACFLIPIPNRGHPCEVDEVSERQNRPAQRQIIEEDDRCGDMYKTMNTSFIKPEAYGKVTAPRGITTMPARTKVQYSRYIYSMTDALKHQKWYAFGRSPKGIADRVAEICSGARFIVDSDFSKMDGHVNGIQRHFEKLVLLRFFAHQHHPAVSELHAAQCNNLAVTAQGVIYHQGDARSSGSPETSWFNTLISAFIAYYAMRMNYQKQDGMEPREAWDNLGLYGGDDGFTANVLQARMTKSAGIFGQNLTTVVLTRGDDGVQFLARYYGPDVWFGDVNSCCDLKRQLSKFHTTTNLPDSVTPFQKLKEKSISFFLTDAQTPVIGELVSKVVKGYVDLEKVDTTENRFGIRQWSSLCLSEDQYPNAYADWMVDLLCKQMPSFDYENFSKWLDAANDETSLLSPPLCTPIEEPVAAAPVVVDDEVLVPKGTTRDIKVPVAPEPPTPESIPAPTPTTTGKEKGPKGNRGRSKPNHGKDRSKGWKSTKSDSRKGGRTKGTGRSQLSAPARAASFKK